MDVHRFLSFAARSLVIAVAIIAAAGCGGEVVGPTAGTTMQLVLHGLRPLDPATEGSYELWVYAASGDAMSAGRFEVSAGDASGDARVDFTLPVSDPARIVVTVEPPGDTDDVPSRSALLGGEVQHGRAHLSIEGSVTDGRPLERTPGHHSLFTTSNNIELGYPSFENSGLWLFSISVDVNPYQRREVHLTPLTPGWMYEGWIVYRQGTPQEVWIPYGTFRPDQEGFLTSRDNTGSGYFSGDADFVNGGVEDVPGDEWTTTRVADQLGLTLPGGLTPPLILNAVDSTTGEAIWHHVITIEPVADEDEPPLTDRPFVLRPYRNPIGAGGPEVPRAILYQQNDPSGDVTPTQ